MPATSFRPVEPLFKTDESKTVARIEGATSCAAARAPAAYTTQHAEVFMNVTRKSRVQNKIALATFAVAIFAGPCRLSAKETGRIEVRIIAGDMCCQGCAQKVAAQLYAAPGVTNVATDVPKRIVTVIANPSPKLTLERLWRAVEKGKGVPSQLITSEATYTLTRLEQLTSSERLAPGQYMIEMAAPQDAADIEKIATLVRSMPGVQRVDPDVSRRTLSVQYVGNVALSEWALVRVVRKSGHLPVRVAGPFGSLAIEYASESRLHTAAHRSNRSMQGGVR
jgi:copper chaperone CopZ